MLGELLLPEIQELIQARDFGALRKALGDLPLPEIVDVFSDLPPADVAVVFRILPRSLAADIFEHLPLETQEQMLRALGDEQVAAVLNEMSPDDRTALLEELPAEAVQRLLGLLTPTERRIAQTLLGYPSESIGRLMTPDYVSIRQDWPMSRVLEHLRRVGRDMETLNILYVVDDRGMLLDDILLREVVIADPDRKVADLMDHHVASLKVADDQEVAIGEFKKHDRSTLPVIDSSGRLVGIVTVDDVLDLAEEEETEDVQKMAAVERLDAPYLDVHLLTMVRKRGLWLAVLFLGELLTASAMAHYEHDLAKALVLMVFVPLIISSGGNSGSQASTLVIRAMAVGEVSLRDTWRVFRREVAGGLLLGGILGVLGLVRVSVWQWMGWNDFTAFYPWVGLTVAVSLVGVVMLGTLAGSMLPMLLRWLRLDPATISAPFVATLVDVSGLIIYFTVASILLRGRLL